MNNSEEAELIPSRIDKPKQTPSRTAKGISIGVGGAIGAALLAWIKTWSDDSVLKGILPYCIPTISIALNSFFLWGGHLISYFCEEIDELINDKKNKRDKKKLANLLQEGNLTEQHQQKINTTLANIDNKKAEVILGRISERIKGIPK